MADEVSETKHLMGVTDDKKRKKSYTKTMKQKILLVGDPRICPQVAYVMDWQDFEQVERLTDVEKYRDYKIVVCAFKKRSKRLVKVRDKSLNIIYLDDVCRKINSEFAQTGKKNGSFVAPVQPNGFWERVRERIIEGRVLIAIYRTILRFIKKPFVFHNYHIINRLPISALKPSELLIKVLYSQPTNIICDRMERIAYLNYDGNVFACCPYWVPAYGSVKSSDLTSIYNGTLARIIRLSSINRSYCLCNLRACEFAKYANEIQTMPEQPATSNCPQELVVAIDRTRNLKCPSCRCEYYTKLDDTEKQTAECTLRELENTGWLNKSELLNIAGDGEVFHSPIYRQMLTSNTKRKQIHILTNGTLFNEQNWQLLKDKYERIGVSVSLDSASEVTFKRLRGGDYQQLLKNLTMLSELRRTGAIAFLEFRFVVQRDNYREMVDFVKFGRHFNADVLLYSRLNNWRYSHIGEYRQSEYRQKSLIIKNKYLTRELYEVLQDPILRDPIVDLSAFQPYLAASAKRYDEQSEASGRVADDKKQK